MIEVQAVPEEISLSALRKEIGEVHAMATATNDVLMCLMEILIDRDPDTRVALLAKLEEAKKLAEAINRHDVAKDIESMFASLKSG